MNTLMRPGSCRPRFVEEAMTDLVAIAYTDEHRAAEVLAALRRLQTGAFADVGDAVSVVRRTDWTVLLSRQVDVGVADDCCFEFWRRFVSSLILSPGVASLRSSVAEYGIDPAFQQRLAMALPPGSSAVFLIVQSTALDRVSADLCSFGGTMCATPIERWCGDEHAAGTGGTGGTGGNRWIP
jgi:uncharacterized membrane protein